MSRITNKWTNTLEGAFGNTEQIKKAVQGEQLSEKFARNTYDEVINHSDDKQKQIQGADFSIKKNSWSRYYTVDVKSNMKHGYFYIENTKDGWLRNARKTTDRIVHIEVSTGYICEYDRRDMIDFLDTNNVKEELVSMSSFNTNIKHFAKRYNILKTANKTKSPRKVKSAIWKESFWN